MKTVVIAATRDFIAVKTVVIPYAPGNPRQQRRSSCQNAAQLTERSREKTFPTNDKPPDFVCKYSILQKLGFITFPCFSDLG